MASSRERGDRRDGRGLEARAQHGRRAKHVLRVGPEARHAPQHHLAHAWRDALGVVDGAKRLLEEERVATRVNVQARREPRPGGRALIGLDQLLRLLPVKPLELDRLERQLAPGLGEHL